MFTIKEVAQDIVDWAFDLIPDLETKYAFAAEYKDLPLPDVACEVVNVRVTEETSDPGWRLESVEQRSLRLYETELVFMVPPDPPQIASDALSDFIDTVTVSLRGGALKDKYSLVSRTYNASFRPPFVELDDGTRGRQVTLQITVGERI